MRILIVSCLLLAPLAEARVIIVDEVSKLLESVRVSNKQTQADISKLILKDEGRLSRELGVFYYNSYSPSQKKQIIETRLQSYSDHLSKNLASYRELIHRVKKTVVKAAKKFDALLPSNQTSKVYLWSSLAGTDASVQKLDGEFSLALNIRNVIAYSPRSLEAVVAHELFHVFQFRLLQNLPETDTLKRALFTEGWATFAASVVVPGAEDWFYVTPFAKDGATFASYEKYHPDLVKELSANLHQSSAEYQKRFFWGGKEAVGREWPTRSGYYVGYLVAQTLSQRLGVKKVLTMKWPEFSGLLGGELSRLSR